LPLKTFQIALLGGNNDSVLVGLRNFPAQKLLLLTPKEQANNANRLANNLRDTLKLPVDIMELGDTSIPAILELVGEIFRKESENFEDFLLNVGSASKSLTCAGVTAAFVHGIKAFDVMGDRPEVLPIMKLSYTQVVSDAKIQILRAVEKAGGEVESLEKLSELSHYGKPLLSYHIRGSEDSRGLVELGLVEAERVKRGRIKVQLTTLGRTLLSTTRHPQKASTQIVSRA
jgi:hypothetical protein